MYIYWYPIYIRPTIDNICYISVKTLIASFSTDKARLTLIFGGYQGRMVSFILCVFGKSDAFWARPPP